MSARFLILTQIFLLCFVLLTNGDDFLNSQKPIDYKELQCLVCEATMDEVYKQVAKIDPTLEVEVGTYRLDNVGNTKRKKIPLNKSEVKLSEIMDSVCNKMDDYARARYKSNGQLTIFPLILPNGGMNPLMGEVDIVQDSDLNKSLKHYCQAIVEEYEDHIIQLYSKDADNVDVRVCTMEAKLCNSELPTDDITDSYNDEL